MKGTKHETPLVFKNKESISLDMHAHHQLI